MYVDRVSLVLDKSRCLKCEICSTVCPRQAVSIMADDADLDITIDPRLCVLCEICSHFCPTGAVTLLYNDQPKAILAEHRALGNFYPAITLDAQKCPEPCPPLPEGESHWCRQERRLVANTLTDCPKSCRVCLTACPRQVVKLAEDEKPGHTMTRNCVCAAPSACRSAAPRPFKSSLSLSAGWSLPTNSVPRIAPDVLIFAR